MLSFLPCHYQFLRYSKSKLCYANFLDMSKLGMYGILQIIFYVVFCKYYAAVCKFRYGVRKSGIQQLLSRSSTRCLDLVAQTILTIPQLELHNYAMLVLKLALFTSNLLSLVSIFFFLDTSYFSLNSRSQIRTSYREDF